MKTVSIVKRSMLFASVLGMVFLGSSCNNDDNEGESLAPLAGKWSFSKVGTTVNGVETLIDAPQNQTGCERDFMDLKPDNTVVQGNYDSTIDACALFSDNGIYSRSHNNLTRVVEGVTTVQDIVNLTLNELKLKEANGNIELYIR
jgi:Lipocalin-like domain